MRKRLLGLFASATVAFAACQGATSPSPSSPAASQPGTQSQPPAASGSPTTSGGTGSGDINLFESTYNDEVEEGTQGGQIIIGDWQEANQFNPFYLSQVTEANVASAVWSTLVVFTHDYKYAPDLAEEIPTTENGGV